MTNHWNRIFLPVRPPTPRPTRPSTLYGKLYTPTSGQQPPPSTEKGRLLNQLSFEKILIPVMKTPPGHSNSWFALSPRRQGATYAGTYSCHQQDQYHKGKAILHPPPPHHLPTPFRRSPSGPLCCHYHERLWAGYLHLGRVRHA